MDVRHRKPLAHRLRLAGMSGASLCPPGTSLGARRPAPVAAHQLKHGNHDGQRFLSQESGADTTVTTADGFRGFLSLVRIIAGDPSDPAPLRTPQP